MAIPKTGAEVRQSFIEFFKEKNHTFVPSASLVPGGDQTLLFTNAGMVQFKDVFLGTDQRSYTRAVNSQKCLRVAGKHNDLDEVGRDNTHHTFFEMLGNWSFGDYYKQEAISWAWELLTERWGLEKSKLWVTVFKDDKGGIESDEEAAGYWAVQPGINPAHIVYSGRKDNFWEMAETGPCGPCSEVHIDLGPEFCDKQGEQGHVCRVNGDCNRIIEFWNLVFIQYNRLDADTLEPLPAKHVDTGMGLERITSVIQKVYSNYATDLLQPLMDKARELAGKTIEEMQMDLTPYRVIADHARAASFLIADGVVPGNIGRNYICRMIIRRASRFGSKIGLNDPFMAEIAEIVIHNYQHAYPELIKNRQAILDSITREEQQFHRTVEAGISQLSLIMDEATENHETMLKGAQLFDLYSTHGLPLEISRDIAVEQGFEVDEKGFAQAMEGHRLASGSGKAFGSMGGEEVEAFHSVVEGLIQSGKIPQSGVEYDPYQCLELNVPVLSIMCQGKAVKRAEPGQEVDLIFPKTGFYMESGGQVGDTGVFVTERARVEISCVRKPAAGVIVHHGMITDGFIETEDVGSLRVDKRRRQDVARNHTATHLLHTALHQVLGDQARQAGSLVAPDRLRFDFTHAKAMTPDELQKVQDIVNDAILNGYPLQFVTKSLEQAMQEGAMALFGEKYGDTVRTVSIVEENGDPFSYELCGGTHVTSTRDLGIFLITTEGSAAAGIRRIEAVTGQGAYQLVSDRFDVLQKSSALLDSGYEEIPERIRQIQMSLEQERKTILKLQQMNAENALKAMLDKVPQINGVNLLVANLPASTSEVLRRSADQFFERYPSGVSVLGSVYDNKPFIIASVSEDLVNRGITAPEIVKAIAPVIGGSGGGKPRMAQAGGKDSSRLDEALSLVEDWLKKKIN